MTDVSVSAKAMSRVLYVAGEIDVAAAPGLQSRLEQAAADAPGVVVVDLGSVTFMDCAGLRPLLLTHTQLGDRLLLRDIPSCVSYLLDITELTEVFSVARRSDGSDDDTHRARALDLESRLAQLTETLRERAVIEQAKGVLMGAHHLTARQAWQLLASAANAHGVPVRDVAAALAATAAGRMSTPPGAGAAAAVTTVLHQPHVGVLRSRPAQASGKAGGGTRSGR